MDQRKIIELFGNLQFPNCTSIVCVPVILSFASKGGLFHTGLVQSGDPSINGDSAPALTGGKL